ncbi:MAG: hypothetical protein ABIZ04_12315 [Opitutus sp.]
MPTRTRSAIFLITALISTSLPLPATIPHLQLGDVATEDIVTPVPLVVLDPEATDALKERTAQQAPSVVRYSPQVANEIEVEVRATLAAARTKFMTALDALQDHPPGEADIGTAVYVAALEYTSHSSAKNLPLEKLTGFWLRGQSDQPLLDSLLQPLREVMAQPVVVGVTGKTDAVLPPTQLVRLVPVKSLSDSVVVEVVETTGQTISPAKVISLARAQRLVQIHYPPSQEQLGEFAASFVRANAVFDPALTNIVRAKRIAGLAVNDTFDAAQVIVRKGQTIDRKALSALAVLREKSLIGTLQTKLDQEQTVAGMIKSQTKWVGAGLAVMVLTLGLILWRLRSRPTDSMLPAIVDPLANAAASGASDAGEWQKRAMEAEGKAERAHEAIRTGALGWMRDKVFHTMFHQRAELLSAQKSAETGILDLEQRLEQLHAPLQERITTYEQRIAELDQELARARLEQTNAPAQVIAQDPETVRREVEARLEELKKPLDERAANYQRRIQELERDLAATRDARPSLRPGFAPGPDPERSIQRRELTVAEREQAVAEAEQRAADRERDLNEMDALLRAREALLSSTSTRSVPNRVTVRGAEALRQFTAELAEPLAPAAPVETAKPETLPSNAPL